MIMYLNLDDVISAAPDEGTVLVHNFVTPYIETQRSGDRAFRVWLDSALACCRFG
jgi:hypothetical protein